MDLDNIRLSKSSLIPCLRDGSFGFAFKSDMPNLLRDYEQDITLYCEDREHDLIDGLTHELTEMSIKKILIEHGYNAETRLKGEICTFKISHLLTVLSLSYYSVQLDYKEQYEIMLKKHKRF